MSPLMKIGKLFFLSSPGFMASRSAEFFLSILARSCQTRSYLTNLLDRKRLIR
jgi:hypothetical protein